jgi:nitrogen fixation/metabolism regulation signal transduction histidine kinase
MTTSAPAAPAEKKSGRHQRSIKNYLLDAPFQLKYTGYLVGVALVISIVLGVFLWRTSNKVVDESAKVVEESKKVSDVVKMQIKDDPIYGDNPELTKAFNDSASDSDNKVAAQQDKVGAQQRLMLTSVIGGLTLLCVLIGLVGIYITHKVAGPIYKMKLLLRQVGQGKLTFPRGGLRKGDELQHFFDVFLKMTDDLKARQQREVEMLEAGIESAKSAGASEETLAKIVAVRDEMKASLDS